MDAEGSANSAQRLSAAVTSSCPQPRKNQNRTGEGKASNKIQRSRSEERENAIHPLWHSGDTEMVQVLHLCQTRPILCREPPVPCPDPQGQFSGKGERQGEILLPWLQQLFRGCCVFILLSHLLITKLLTCETQQHLQPAFWILPLGIWLQPWQGAGSTTSSRRERESDSAPTTVKAPMAFPRRTLVQTLLTFCISRTE